MPVGVGRTAGGEEQRSEESSDAHGASQDRVEEVRGGRSPGRHGRDGQMTV